MAFFEQGDRAARFPHINKSVARSNREFNSPSHTLLKCSFRPAMSPDSAVGHELVLRLFQKVRAADGESSRICESQSFMSRSAHGKSAGIRTGSSGNMVLHTVFATVWIFHSLSYRRAVPA